MTSEFWIKNIVRNNINDTIRYDFVEDSCGDKTEINEFKSLMIENGLQMSRISIKSFQFKDFENEKIFIHCKVQISICLLSLTLISGTRM